MIIFFDTETTGLYPGNICQLSYIMKSADSVRGKNYFFTVDKVEYGAYLVHGFSVPMLYSLSDGKRFKDFIDEIETDFSNAKTVVAHNASFDFMFLRAEFEKCGRTFMCDNGFCSMKKSVPICKIPRARGAGYKYPKLSELCSHFGIDEWDIKAASAKLFGESANFHDARFDTTALYLASIKAMECESCFETLKESL